MENKNNMMDTQSKMERSQLLGFSVFYLFTIVLALKAQWSPVVPFTIMISLGASWVMSLRKSFDFPQRAFANVFFVHIVLILISFHKVDFTTFLLVYITLVVFSGLYGVETLMIIPAVSETIIIISKLAKLYGVHTIQGYKLMNHIAPFFLIYFIDFILYFWMKKRRQAQQNMGENIARLARAEQGNREFLMNVSHEILSPVKKISDLCDHLSTENNINYLQSNLRYAHASSEMLTYYFDNITDFAMIQAHGFKLQNQEYEMADVVQRWTRLCVAIKNKKNIDIIFDIDTTLPKRLYGDADRICRAVSNILEAASSFTEHGGILLSVTMCKEGDGVNLLITIKDTGKGLSQERIDGLRFAFSQSKENPTDKRNALSLNTIMAYYIVSQMGGRFNISSTVGEGTTVNMIIPQGVVNGERVVSTCKGGTILYLNDDNIHNTILKDTYQNLCQHWESQLESNFAFCNSMTLFQKYLREGDYANIVISYEDFLNYKKYFLHIAERRRLIVTYEYYERVEVDVPNVLLLQKPINILSLVEKINEEIPVVVSTSKQETQKVEASDKTKEVSGVETPSDISENQGLVIGRLDTSLGNLYCGNIKTYLNILRDYGNRGSKSWELIQSLYDDKNWKEYTIEVHGIKSSMLTIGAKRLSEKAKELEMAGKAGDYAVIENLHPLMIEEYKAVIHEIQEYFGIEVEETVQEVFEGDAIELTESDVKELLSDLEEAAYSLDKEAMENCVSKLQGCVYGQKSLNDLYHEAMRKVASDDYMSALDLITKMLS